MIFVFGSNTRGVHGAGAAKHAALHHGAVYGIGFGQVGNSYAIPTKDHNIITLPLNDIKKYIQIFLIDAASQPNKEFKVTCIGCGLAGLKHEDIAPMFMGASDNCLFDEKWRPYLGSEKRYWGAG